VNHENTVLRCDRRYLGTILTIQLGVLTIVAVLDLIFLGAYALAGVCILLAITAAVRWAIHRTYRFTLGDDVVRTEKLFTQHIDVRTPVEKVVSVSAYEGIVEAIVGVGTVEISTASSDSGHATIRWPHVRGHRKVVAAIEQRRSYSDEE